MVLWNDEGENSLWLITEEELNRLPDGIVLESIMGDFVTKGVDDINRDTRMSALAFGVRNPFNHAEKNLFLIFALMR